MARTRSTEVLRMQYSCNFAWIFMFSSRIHGCVSPWTWNKWKWKHPQWHDCENVLYNVYDFVLNVKSPVSSSQLFVFLRIYLCHLWNTQIICLFIFSKISSNKSEINMTNFLMLVFVPSKGMMLSQHSAVCIPISFKNYLLFCLIFKHQFWWNFLKILHNSKGILKNTNDSMIFDMKIVVNLDFESYSKKIKS